MLYANFENKGLTKKRNLANNKNIFSGKLSRKRKISTKWLNNFTFLYRGFKLPTLNFFLLCQKSPFSYFRQNVQYLQIHIVFHKRYSRKHEKNLQTQRSVSQKIIAKTVDLLSLMNYKIKSTKIVDCLELHALLNSISLPPMANYAKVSNIQFLFVYLAK